MYIVLCSIEDSVQPPIDTPYTTQIVQNQREFILASPEWISLYMVTAHS